MHDSTPHPNRKGGNRVLRPPTNVWTVTDSPAIPTHQDPTRTTRPCHYRPPRQDGGAQTHRPKPTNGRSELQTRRRCTTDDRFETKTPRRCTTDDRFETKTPRRCTTDGGSESKTPGWCTTDGRSESKTRRRCTTDGRSESKTRRPNATDRGSESKTRRPKAPLACTRPLRPSLRAPATAHTRDGEMRCPLRPKSRHRSLFWANSGGSERGLPSP